MKSKTKVVTFMLSALAFAALTGASATNLSRNVPSKPNLKLVTPKKAAEEDDVLFKEDFTQETSTWANFDFIDGKAVYNAAGTWTNVPIPASAFVESNNYEFSMHIKYTDSQSVFLHLAHADGDGENRNLYLEIIGGGAFWRFANFGECDIYGNSGEDQGSLGQNFQSKLQNEGIELKFVVLDEVIEIYGEGRRIISVPYTAFGNNRYGTKTRRAIKKGIIDGFGIDFRGAAGSLIIDKFEMREAKKAETYYHFENKITDGFYTMPLTYKNLYRENFSVSADFEVHRGLVENGENHAYPKIQLLMNQIIPNEGVTLSDPSNFLNFQEYLDREFQTAWLGGISPSTGSWAGAGGQYVQSKFDDTKFNMTVDVNGDNIKMTTRALEGPDAAHSVDVIETSFANLGLTKGKLLAVRLQNEWTNVLNGTYIGYEGNTGIISTISGNRFLSGREVVANAQVFGQALADGAWYLDGTKTEVTGLEFKSSAIAVGNHTLAYGNDTVKSNPVSFEVFDNLITISADKTELYPIDTIKITAEKEGDFTGLETSWEVNGVKVEGETGDELELTDLEVGDYEVVCKAGTYISNKVSFTVKTPTIKVEASKGAYDVSEKALLKATTAGLSDDDHLVWYANDEILEQTGKEIELPLAAYEEAGQVEIYALSASGIESNKITLFITHDVYARLSGDENWKCAYKQEIAENDTFGAYSAVADTDGSFYYMPQNSDGGNDAQFPAVTIETQLWSMEYDLFIPESVKGYGGEYYVYPQAAGMDSKHPNDFIELALGVGNAKVRPYVKTHEAGVIYEYKDFNTGLDLTYGEGVVDFGWNHIVYAMEGNTGTFYINGKLAFYATIPNSTVPGGFVMSMYPGAGGKIPLGFKNFSVYGVVEPAPEVAAVNLSASAVSIKVGQTAIFSASVSPYNAEYETIEWYVNGQKVEGENKLTYTFTGTAAGSYEIMCKIDGIESNKKTITVTEEGQSGGDEGSKKKGCGGEVIATSALVSIVAISALGLAIAKKKQK